MDYLNLPILLIQSQFQFKLELSSLIQQNMLYIHLIQSYHFWFKNMTEPHVELNEEIPQKYESYSNVKDQQFNTLDQPILHTINRDLKVIVEKIRTTLSGEGDYAKLQRQWDLWGPLMISLLTAGLAAFSTKGNSEDAFINIFIVLWFGPLLIALNSRLLGSKIPIIQTMCLIIYCSAPVLFLTVMVFIMNFIHRSFFINFLMAIMALLFTLRCNFSYFKTLNSSQKQLLSIYPVLLFYVFICLFISMI